MDTYCHMDGATLRLECRRKDEEIAKLREELEHVKHLLTCESIKCERAEKRAEAAEELVRKARAQEPVVADRRYFDDEQKPTVYIFYSSSPVLYTRPIPPADVAELQERAQFWADRCGMLEGRVAELERKLNDAVEKQPCNAGACKEEMIWREELAKAREEGYEQGKRDAVPEGWQVVPIEATPEMVRAGMEEYGEEVFAAHQVTSVYRDMLATAPKPEVKP